MQDNDNRQRAVNKPQLPALITTDIVDGDAIAIGELYEQSKLSFLDSVNAGLECGQRLTEKKASLAHGEWGAWLDDNAIVLGFKHRSTAKRLMRAAKANGALTRHLDLTEALQISRKMWGNDAHVAANSGENEWYTPTDIIERARAVLGGFDLDPASSLLANETVQASKIFTADDDGLYQEWPVGRIWMNPPYAQPLIGKFCQRFADEMGAGSTGIALVNNATETEWFQTLSACASAICFPRGRVRFLDENGDPGAPLQGQAIIYCGALTTRIFEDVFSDLGFVARVSR